MDNYDVFISYRRTGGFETAKHLYDLLTRDGYRVSFDIDTLREGDFDDALLERIDMCQDFILIVDPHAFDRTLDATSDPKNDWLRQELSYALYAGKNIIPILLAGASFPDGLPADVAAAKTKNGPAYSRDYFDSFYHKLKSFLHSEPQPANHPWSETNGKDSGRAIGAEIHIEVDSDCSVFRFKERIADAKADEDNVIHLLKGKHRLFFVSRVFPSVKEEIILEIPSLDYSDFISVHLREKELELIELRPVKENNLWGFADESGKVVIPFEYEEAFGFEDGLSWVRKDGKYGVIDKKGDVVAPFIYDDFNGFTCNLSGVKKNGSWGFLGIDGHEKTPFIYDEIYEFREGLSLVKKGGKWGYLNADLQVVIPFQFDDANSFGVELDEGTAIVQKDGKHFIINHKGEVVYDDNYPFLRP